MQSAIGSLHERSGMRRPDPDCLYMSRGQSGCMTACSHPFLCQIMIVSRMHTIEEAECRSSCLQTLDDADKEGRHIAHGVQGQRVEDSDGLQAHLAGHATQRQHHIPVQVQLFLFPAKVSQPVYRTWQQRSRGGQAGSTTGMAVAAACSMILLQGGCP